MQPTTITVQHLKLQIVELQNLTAPRQVTKSLQYNSTDGIKLGITEFFRKSLIKLLNRRTCFNCKRSIRMLFYVIIVFNVIFIFNVADNLLQHIFNGD